MHELALDKTKLLNGEYPIFISSAYHLLSSAGMSSAGNWELFYVRTKVVQAVVSNEYGRIDRDTLSIQRGANPIILGWQQIQTPELFTTPYTQILEKCGDYTYEKTNEDKFDKDGAKKIEQMTNGIKEISENCNF